MCLMRGVKEMTTLIVLKQTTALGPERTVLARFNLVCFNVLMSFGRAEGESH